MASDVSPILSAGDLNKDTPTPLDTLTKWQSLASSRASQHLTEQETENQKQDLVSKRVGALGGWSYALSFLPDEMVTPDFMRQHVDQAVQMGLATPEQAAVIKSNIKDGMTGAQLKQQAALAGHQILKPTDQQTLNTPDYRIVNQGNQNTVVGITKPGSLTGPPGAAPMGSLPTSLSTEEAHKMQTVMDANGKETTDTTAGLIARGLISSTGIPAPGFILKPGPAGGGGGGAVPPPLAGSLPPQAGAVPPPPPAATAAPPPAPAPAPAGNPLLTGPNAGKPLTGPGTPAPAAPVPVTTAPPPQPGGGALGGAPVTLGSAGQPKRPDLKSNIETYIARNKAIPQVDQQVADNVEAFNLMRDVASGKGAQVLNLVRSGAVTILGKLGVDISAFSQALQDKNYDLANKVLTRAMLNQPTAGLSVPALEATQHANPNLDNMNHDAMMAAVQRQIGISRMDNAMIRAYKRENPNATGSDINDYLDKFYKDNSNREIMYEGFASDLVTVGQYKKRLAELGGKDSPKGRAYARAAAQNQLDNGVKIGQNAGIQ